MTPEERELLEKTYRLADDTNDMVRRLYRSYRWGRYAKIAYWAVIILLLVGAYWLVQPYLDQLRKIYSGASDAVQNIHNAVSNTPGFSQ